MLALKGYFDGNSFIPLSGEKIEENRVAIITVLDEFVNEKEKLNKKLSLVSKVAGMLKNEDESTVSQFDEIISKRFNLSRMLEV